MNYFVVDIEGDSLTPSYLHCLSYSNLKGDKRETLISYDSMRNFLLQEDTTFIFHYGILFDKPSLERLLDIKILSRIIDTCAVSWYLEDKRKSHNLEDYGLEFNYPKVEVLDWVNLPIEVYTERCEVDVEITRLLWLKQRKELLALYNDSSKPVEEYSILRYLEFKMECVAKQEGFGWEFDKEFCEEGIEYLTNLIEPQVETLKEIMPKVTKYGVRRRPVKPFLKNGEYSAGMIKWLKLLEDEGLPSSYLGEVQVPIKHEEPNPGSHVQIKDWLFSLGWEPETFEYKWDDKGNSRKIPKIKPKNSDEVCSSIKKLFPKEPNLEILNNLSILEHRKGLLTGFLRDQENNTLKASCNGFTNTLRLKHREIVNLPSVNKVEGKWARGCLKSRKGYILLGCDMVSLEDTTKRHYIQPYDPEYVAEMEKPGYDPHLDLALTAGRVTKQDIEDHKNKVKDLTSIRTPFKTTNYSATYLIKAPSLSRDLKCSVEDAQKLLDIYWARNWSLLEFTKDIKTKTVNKKTWAYNPVSKYWYSLRNEKDKFSTVNQSTGVFCFDLMLRCFLKYEGRLLGQFHDEFIFEINPDTKEQVKENLKKAIDEVNKILKLNIVLKIDYKFGERYSDIH